MLKCMACISTRWTDHCVIFIYFSVSVCKVLDSEPWVLSCNICLWRIIVVSFFSLYSDARLSAPQSYFSQLLHRPKDAALSFTVLRQTHSYFPGKYFLTLPPKILHSLIWNNNNRDQTHGCFAAAAFIEKEKLSWFISSSHYCYH